MTFKGRLPGKSLKVKKRKLHKKICSCHSNQYIKCLQLCHVTETVSDLCRNAVNSLSINDRKVVKSEPKRGMFYRSMQLLYNISHF